MPGKRARRHLSHLKVFERGLIIGMKTAGWSTRHVVGQVDHSECAVRNCWEQWKREVTRSTIRADVDVAIVPQTTSRHFAEANLKFKRPFRALPLTPEHRQLRLQWCQARSMWKNWKFQIGKRLCLVMNPAKVAQDFLHHFQTFAWLARSPDLSPVKHVWDQLKRQMPSCHSVHDLELAVQDLWAHLLQDNIRCLINSMPYRVSACIAAGGGPTRY
ncbi:transposable element Tcb2 transposase [Trichonephila clavipes]|nr:transposable element Tcb2 transposase [Trichonephila clavipes]